MGGAGHPVPPATVNWQERSKRKVKVSPRRYPLDELMDKVVSEVFNEAIENPSTQLEALEVVQPFIENEQVNWTNFEQDVEAVQQLSRLYRKLRNEKAAIILLMGD